MLAGLGLSVRLHTTMNWNRILSGLLVVFYITTAFATSGAKSAFVWLLFVILPLACIWFGDEMGGYTGASWGGAITDQTPGLLVCIAGWLLLLLPIFLGIYLTLAGSKS
jgi:hypothetical protein